MKDKCCINCKFSRWELTPKGRVRDKSGTCKATFVEPVLPACIARPFYHRCFIWKGDGKECPLYEEATGKPKGESEPCE